MTLEILTYKVIILNPKKNIIYVYLTQPVGKIGGCFGIDGFEQCWATR
ncbi:hypothetical protein N9O88_01135 [bacterium]|nr:hypothetical protein [bacterium]